MKKIIICIVSICSLLALTSCKSFCKHEFSDWQIIEEATCISQGERKHVCSKCGVQESEVIEIDENNHNYEYIGMIDDSDKGNYKCSRCNKEDVLPLRFMDLNIPIVRMEGDFNLLTADKNSETFKFSYEDENINFDGYASVKLQGSSSIRYPKKNYSIKLYEDEDLQKKHKVELFEGVGKVNKYVLKANWIDCSQARNVVSGIIYSDIAKTRNNADDISKLSNSGVVDGYPVAVYENGVFHGLYTLNIAKDDYMFGMSDDDKNNPGSIKQAVISTNSWSGYSKLYYHAPNPIETITDLEFEYLSTEDTIGQDWAIDSYNEMIDFINNYSGQSFKDGLSKYINVDRTIDALIYTYVISASDNLSKNINYITYDGKIFQPNLYDMDGTWGLYWNGQMYGNSNMLIPNEENLNLLYAKVFTYYRDEINQRYTQLRKGPLSYQNIEKRFTEFFDKIPENIKQMDMDKWIDYPSYYSNNLEQILDYAKTHLDLMDRYYLLEN